MTNDKYTMNNILILTPQKFSQLLTSFPISHSLLPTSHSPLLTNFEVASGAGVLPLGLRPDQICARAYVGDAVAGHVDTGAVESNAVVADFDHQVCRVFGAHLHLHMLRLSMPADIVERLLNHSVKLNPFDVRKPQAVFQVRLACEFVGEFLFGGQLRHGVAQGPFERWEEADVF